MTRPRLFVIAGCNGSGKSSFANVVTPVEVESFDYDKEYLREYNSIKDSELRAVFAHQKTRHFLEESINFAIKNRLDFCYETNFNSTPMYWPEKFKDAGFELVLFFFCLDKIVTAKERVRIRVENGGHFVPDIEIEERFRLGYTNLNKFFTKFDFVHLVNTSGYNKEPNHIMTIHSEKIFHLAECPSFLLEYAPEIVAL
mgnify:CR=1 FL=1